MFINLPVMVLLTRLVPPAMPSAAARRVLSTAVTIRNFSAKPKEPNSLLFRNTQRNMQCIMDPYMFCSDWEPSLAEVEWQCICKGKCPRNDKSFPV